MRTPRAILLIAPFTLLSSGASAQVLISEVQSNPTSQMDMEEWIEIQNTGTASVSLEGWSINDFVGTADPNNESATRWTFPAGAALGPSEVIVVTRQNLQFTLSLGIAASWELDDVIDDPNVPNLMPVGGTDDIALGNQAGGDAVVLRDAAGTLVSWVEWGTLDRNPPGTPFTSAPGSGQSLVRIDVTGVSANDFAIADTPTPFVGFMSSETMILGTMIGPRHVSYAGNYEVSAMVTDADGLNTVEIYFATATSSAGPATGNYLATTMTSSGSTYSFFDTVANLGGGFPEPENFHSRYIRFFILAEDNNLDVATEPAMADEAANNPNYLPSYVQNVLPAAPTPIAEAREPAAEDVPAWEGHSVRVRGIALVDNGVLDPARTLFTIQDSSNAAITFFGTSTVAPAFAAGDELVLTGVIGTFRGSTQLGEGTIEVTGNTGNIPESTLTLAQILADGEQYEGELVKVDDVDFVDPRANWPSDPGDLGSWNVPITDEQGNQITLRVTSGATGVFGAAAPQFGFDVRGILNERDGTWQLFPRSAEDISAHPMPPPPDAGMTDMDATTGQDTGVRPDAGTGTDSGTGTNPDEEGCDCSAAPSHGSSGAFGLILLALCAFIRRRK